MMGAKNGSPLVGINSGVLKSDMRQSDYSFKILKFRKKISKKFSNRCCYLFSWSNLNEKIQQAKI